MAVSGGADSLALAHLLSQRVKKLHVLTVDHGLRPESTDEARHVSNIIAQWPNAVHQTLTWSGRKPKTGIQEAARNARYHLMAAYCRDHGIGHLALAHHADDQAETFLIRLTHGSGLDGLAGMAALTPYDASLTLWRPLLKYGHKDLIAYCRANKLAWVEDPGNHNDHFTRVRLRQSRGILETEGLTFARLATTASRLNRARDALTQLAEKKYKSATIELNAKQIVLKKSVVLSQPFDIAIRILQIAMQQLRTKGASPPRLEKLEEIVDALYTDPAGFKAATLAGCIIRHRPASRTSGRPATITLTLE